MLTIDQCGQQLSRAWAQVSVVGLVHLVNQNDVAGNILHTSFALPSLEGHLCVDNPVVQDYGICYRYVTQPTESGLKLELSLVTWALL